MSWTLLSVASLGQMGNWVTVAWGALGMRGARLCGGLIGWIRILRRRPPLGTSGWMNKPPLVDECWGISSHKKAELCLATLCSLAVVCCGVENVGEGVKARGRAPGLVSVKPAAGWCRRTWPLRSPWSLPCWKNGVGWLITKGSSALTVATSNYKIIFMFVFPPVIWKYKWEHKTIKPLTAGADSLDCTHLFTYFFPQFSHD